MRTCVVCNKKYGFNLLWDLEKFWFRITEKSLLWENCCSGECYFELLTNIVSGKWKLEDNDGNDLFKS